MKYFSLHFISIPSIVKELQKLDFGNRPDSDYNNKLVHQIFSKFEITNSELKFLYRCVHPPASCYLCEFLFQDFFTRSRIRQHAMKLRRRNDKTRALAFIPDELFAELVRLISVMMNSVVMIVIAPNELCDVVLEDS